MVDPSTGSTGAQHHGIMTMGHVGYGACMLPTVIR